MQPWYDDTIGPLGHADDLALGCSHYHGHSFPRRRKLNQIEELIHLGFARKFVVNGETTILIAILEGDAKVSSGIHQGKVVWAGRVIL